jgi:hypothetical protein
VSFKIDFEQGNDGRWIAEIASFPGVMVYRNQYWRDF